MTRLGVLQRWLILGLLIAVTTTVWLQLCHLVFDCGCRSLWTGAAEHCNIHAAPEGSPHRCPWCASALAGGVSFVGTMVWFALSLLGPWPARFKSATRLQEGLLRLALAGLAIPIFVFGVGWLSGALTGYWS